MTAVTPDGKVFVIGGRKASEYMATTIELKFHLNAVIDRKQVFNVTDPTNNSVPYHVVRRKAMNEKRGNIALVAANKELFAIGGCDQFHSKNVVEALDIKKDVWRTLASLRTPREQASACLFRNRELYVFGGLTNTLETLNQNCSEMINKDLDLQAALIDNTPIPSMYNYASTIEVYDLREGGKWNEISIQGPAHGVA